jgi:hypothetical protein
MLKPYSTKLARPIPPEFEPSFIAGGWAKVNQMFGKRPAVRYFTALGPERLSIARLAAVRKARVLGKVV